MFSIAKEKVLPYCVLVLLLSLVESISGDESDLKLVAEIPADLPTCKGADVNINDCMTQLFQKVMLNSKTGIKELNIPPLDPYVLEKNTYQFSSGIVRGRVSIRNVRLYGMSDTIIDGTKFELKNGHMRMEIKTHLSKLLIEGEYKANVRINDLKLTPKGFFNVSLTNIHTVPTAEGETFERDGRTFIRLTKYKGDPEVGDLKVYADGLFPDPTLSALTLDFINQYWRQIYTAMLPESQNTYEPYVINVANKILSTIPIDIVINHKK